MNLEGDMRLASAFEHAWPRLRVARRGSVLLAVLLCPESMGEALMVALPTWFRGAGEAHAKVPLPR